MSIVFVILVINIKRAAGVQLVERVRVAKNLSDLLLFQLLPALISAHLALRTTGSRKDHTVDKFADAPTVRISQNFREDALKESPVLKLPLLLAVPACPLAVPASAGIGVVALVLGGDEAVEVG